MINGTNLGMGIMSFLIGTMIWFSALLILLINQSVLIFLGMLIIVLMEYIYAVISFSRLYESKKEGKNNGTNRSKKRR